MTVLSVNLKAQLKMIWIKKLLSDERLIINSPFKKGEIGENPRLWNIEGLPRVLSSLLKKIINTPIFEQLFTKITDEFSAADVV